MTDIKIADVMFDGKGYMLAAEAKAAGTRAARATRKLDCNPRAHGSTGRGAIKSGDYFIYLRGEGRMCCACAISIGNLELADWQP